MVFYKKGGKNSKYAARSTVPSMLSQHVLNTAYADGWEG
jgi:hypothetical protein